MIELLSPRLWIALALAAALTFAGFFLYRAGKAAVRVEFTEWKLAAEENRLLADRAQRAEEQRREDNNRKVIDEAKQRTDLARADAVRAAGMHDRVRKQLDTYIAAVRRASADTAAPSGSPAGTGSGDALGLLADLFSGADSIAGDLASALDRSRIAGQACERAYDGLQPTSGK